MAHHESWLRVFSQTGCCTQDRNSSSRLHTRSKNCENTSDGLNCLVKTTMISSNDAWMWPIVSSSKSCDLWQMAKEILNAAPNDHVRSRTRLARASLPRPPQLRNRADCFRFISEGLYRFLDSIFLSNPRFWCFQTNKRTSRKQECRIWLTHTCTFGM